MALAEHRHGGQHADDQQRGDEDDELQVPPGKPGVSPRDDQRDHEREADEDRGGNPEDDVVSVHGARIR